MNADNKTCFHSFFYARGKYIDKFNVFYHIFVYLMNSMTIITKRKYNLTLVYNFNI